MDLQPKYRALSISPLLLTFSAMNTLCSPVLWCAASANQAESTAAMEYPADHLNQQYSILSVWIICISLLFGLLKEAYEKDLILILASVQRQLFRELVDDCLLQQRSTSVQRTA